MNVQSIKLVLSFIYVVAYPAALFLGLRFPNPFYELPLVLLFLFAVLIIRAHYRKRKMDD